MSSDRCQGVLLTIAYDGTRFHGMAVQDQQRTVAEHLQAAIARMDPNASKLRVTSRTDAGVHAHAQRVAFDSTREIAPRGWLLGLSEFLDRDVAIVAAESVPLGFDPRDYVVSKTYEYRIFQSVVRDPFHENRAWRISERLNHAAMLAEAQVLVGRHNFAAFRSVHDPRTNTEREMLNVGCHVDATDARLITWEITGDHFMMHMVRIIMGTLVDVGRGRLQPGACLRALTSCDRRDLGMTAPPHGLYLRQIELSRAGTNRWPRVDDGTPVTYVPEPAREVR